MMKKLPPSGPRHSLKPSRQAPPPGKRSNVVLPPEVFEDHVLAMHRPPPHPSHIEVQNTLDPRFGTIIQQDFQFNSGRTGRFITFLSKRGKDQVMDILKYEQSSHRPEHVAIIDLRLDKVVPKHYSRYEPPAQLISALSVASERNSNRALSGGSSDSTTTTTVLARAHTPPPAFSNAIWDRVPAWDSPPREHEERQSELWPPVTKPSHASKSSLPSPPPPTSLPPIPVKEDPGTSSAKDSTADVLRVEVTVLKHNFEKVERTLKSFREKFAEAEEEAGKERTKRRRLEDTVRALKDDLHDERRRADREREKRIKVDNALKDSAVDVERLGQEKDQLRDSLEALRREAQAPFVVPTLVDAFLFLHHQGRKAGKAALPE